MINKILIPTDDSANSLTALDTEFNIAHKLGAVLIGLYVLDVNLIQGPMLTDISGSVGNARLTTVFLTPLKHLLTKRQIVS